MAIKNPHARSFEDLKNELPVDQEKGLTSKEVQQQQSEYGKNELEEKKGKSIWQIILDQINTPVVYLLAAAATLSFIFGDLAEGFFIVAVILVNAIIGFVMERQAQKSMSALKEMEKDESIVLRDGEEKQVESSELVPGDIMLVEPGDMIQADGRIIESAEFEINEASLTGESVPVEKKRDDGLVEDTPLGDRKNMVYKGTAVTKGTAKILLTNTGMTTEIGNISKMVSEAEGEEVPLNKKLNKLTHRLIWVVLGLATILGINASFTGKDIYTIVQTSIAWAIAAIPEGLPIVASIALARGMLRLAKQNVVVKKLAAVEALGEVNDILTDKTGTLTENKLTLTHFCYELNDVEIKWKENKPEFSEEIPENYYEKLFQISTLCNSANLDKDTGDPLEIGLLKFTSVEDENLYEKLKNLEKVNEDPFDSESMMMGTIHKLEDNYLVSVKGAATAVAEISPKILTGEGVKDFSKEDKDKWLEKNDELAQNGLRTLALAYREDDQPDEDEEFIHDLTFVGLIGFIDPPREDVKGAMETFHKAGIEIVMMTGDHPGTAKNIAEQVNLANDSDMKVLSGKEIEDSSSEDIRKTKVFARVDPEQKLKLMEKFQEGGNIVGMTGDGVNDAPALKKANIGVAMGERGTQVAKENADLILKDDAFPSILNAIRQGRIIFGNIRKFIVYQLSYHFSEILVIAAATFIISEIPLLPLQLLFLNLLTDVFPALALGIGKGREDVMNKPPKDPNEPIITKKSWAIIGVYGFVIGAFVSAAYFYGYFSLGFDKELSNNVAFFSLAITQLLHVFDMKEHNEPLFVNQVTKNKYVWMAISLCGAVLTASYFIPYFRDLLSFQSIPNEALLLILAVPVCTITVIQVLKKLFKI